MQSENENQNRKSFFTIEDIDKALSIKTGTTKAEIKIGKSQSIQKIPKCCDAKRIKCRHVGFGFHIIKCSECNKTLKVFRVLPAFKQKLNFLLAIDAELDEKLNQKLKDVHYDYYTKEN